MQRFTKQCQTKIFTKDNNILPFPILKSLSEIARLIDDESSLWAEFKLFGFPRTNFVSKFRTCKRFIENNIKINKAIC